MVCCSNCFADTEIKAIISGNKIMGNCDFCGSHNVPVFEIGKDETITELFDGLLDIYTPVSDLPGDFPRSQTDMIKNILFKDWNIFNLKPDAIYRLITELCSIRYKEQPELFDGPVGIRQSQDHEYLEENSILKNNCWSDFVNGIKRENRFHSDFINTDKLFTFLRCAVKPHRKGEILFRSRICHDVKGYQREKMGAPPYDKAKGAASILMELVYCILPMKQKLHCMKSALVSMITLQ